MNTEDSWAAFSQVIDWIKLADGKATAILATAGVLGGILVGSHPSESHSFGAVDITLFVVALGAVALSASLSLHVLAPRMGGKGDPTSLLYFDHVARRFGRDRDGYVAAFTDMNADASVLQREIGNQIWTNSLVARKKFRHVTHAMWLLGLAMGSAGLMTLLQNR